MTDHSYLNNSISEFLAYTNQAGEDTIEVRIEDKMVWLSQKK